MTELDEYIEYLEDKYDELRKSRNVICGVKDGLVRKCMTYHNVRIKHKMKNIEMCIDSARRFKDKL